MKRKKTPSDLFASSSPGSRRGDKRLISVRLSQDLLERLAAVGNAEGLSMSDTLRLVLERGSGSADRIDELLLVVRQAASEAAGRFMDWRYVVSHGRLLPVEHQAAASTSGAVGRFPAYSEETYASDV